MVSIFPLTNSIASLHSLTVFSHSLCSSTPTLLYFRSLKSLQTSLRWKMIFCNILASFHSQLSSIPRIPFLVCSPVNDSQYRPAFRVRHFFPSLFQSLRHRRPVLQKKVLSLTQEQFGWIGNFFFDVHPVSVPSAVGRQVFIRIGLELFHLLGGCQIVNSSLMLNSKCFTYFLGLSTFEI